MRKEVLDKIHSTALSAQVHLANMEINDAEIDAIILKIYALNPNVSLINLDGNNLSNEGALVLTNALHSFNQLRKLSIQSNQIGRAGAIALFSLKKTLANLSIFFHGNKIVNVTEMVEIECLARK